MVTPQISMGDDVRPTAEWCDISLIHIWLIAICFVILRQRVKAIAQMDTAADPCPFRQSLAHFAQMGFTLSLLDNIWKSDCHFARELAGLHSTRDMAPSASSDINLLKTNKLCQFALRGGCVVFLCRGGMTREHDAAKWGIHLSFSMCFGAMCPLYRE